MLQPGGADRAASAATGERRSRRAGGDGSRVTRGLHRRGDRGHRLRGDLRRGHGDGRGWDGGTLIRDLASSQAPGALAVACVEAPLGGAAMPGVGGAACVAVSVTSAAVIAVDVPAVAAEAEGEERLAEGTADREEEHRARPIKDTRKGR